MREPDEIKGLKKSTNNNLITVCWKKVEIVFLNHVGFWPFYFEFRSLINEHIHQNPQPYCFDYWNCLRSHIDLYKVGSISCTCKSCSCMLGIFTLAENQKSFRGRWNSALDAAVHLFQFRKNLLPEEYRDQAWLTFFKPGHGNMPFLYGVPMYPLLVTIAFFLCRIGRIRPTWSQSEVTRTYCWLACREDRLTFLFVWKYRLIHVGHYQWQQRHEGCRRRLQERHWSEISELLKQTHQCCQYGTFEWILFNLRFRMFCTNLIVTARNGKLLIIQTKQCCCCRYFWMECRQPNEDTCVKWIHIKDCFRVFCAKSMLCETIWWSASS